MSESIMSHNTKADNGIQIRIFHELWQLPNGNGNINFYAEPLFFTIA